MQTMTSKKAERSEKKKKKLAALANLVKLNDKDRESTSSIAASNTQSDSDSSDEKNKAKKSKVSEDKHEDEPKTKKIKLTNEDDSQSNDSSSTNDDGSEAKKLNLTQEQYVQLKKELKERKRELENVPKFRLRPAGYSASLEVPQESRTPIFLTDVQHLLMSALIGKKSPCSPDRWCYLEKPLRLSHTLILVLDGVSLYHYLSNEDKFIETKKIFESKLEVVLPVRGENHIIQDLATAPLTNVQTEELIAKYGSLEAAIEMTKDPTLLVKSMFPIDPEEEATTEEGIEIPKQDKYPRTKLLLSALQMVDEGYPVPLRGELKSRFNQYVFTKDKYAPVTPNSPMFGVDCEMCRTTTGQNELTRISIVNEQYETVYETLVMPTNKIVDYLTKYSGITPELMATVTKNLREVQKEVRALLPADAILVGQSLNSDLHAMKMLHPYVIDTSVIFNITGNRKRKSKLQTLAMTFLDQMIQEKAGGHDSVEDSLASIRLVQLKLKHSLDFGDEILYQKRRVNEIIRLATADSIKNNLFGQVSTRDKRTAIINTGPMHPGVKEICDKATANDKLKSILCIETENNKESVKKTREIALEHALTITNLSVEPEKFQLDRIDGTVSKIDKWISKLWKTVAHNGLFLVLFGGAEDSPSGLLQVAIKRNEADVAEAVPITV
ncbi:RNA exonuclease 5 [Episyrphus balteatus]|uniref:RNA exonuclease 5 n=1 Tax=Episyrphus balteatus TaxID=286459 RepID=UPI002485A57F|nr:RNA exonuclease 5 [Episyrphus balteatus]